MPETNGHLFYHRLNRDGTHDSICCRCYLTVATVDQESSLATREESHVCDPLQGYVISRYFSRAIERVDQVIKEHRNGRSPSPNV